MQTARSRRFFLQLLGSGAALRPDLRGTGAGFSWSSVRDQFPFAEEHVPMNAANLCPAPRLVAERAAEMMRDIEVDCSFQNRAKFKTMLEETRGTVARQLGVSADELALVRNTTEANNIINNGLPLEAGDEVVLWDQNHPTNNVAWDVRAARFGIKVKRVAVPQAPTGVDELAGIFEQAFSERTRVLSITHLSNVSGIRLPVRELCEMAHRRGIFVHVDGAQTWGALKLNLHDLGCDSYSASAHKWFMGPKEVGILYVRRERVGEIWPGTVGAGWGDDAETDADGARKFESAGQRNDASLAALGAAAEFYDGLGPERVEARMLELAGALKERLADLGLKLVTPAQPELSGGVCIVEAEPENGQQAYERLYRECGIAGATTGGLRLCPHVYNTMDHIDRTAQGLAAMRHLLRHA